MDVSVLTSAGARYARAALDETRSHLAELFAGRFTVSERLPWNGLALVYKSTSPSATVALAVLPLDCENDSENKEVFEKAMHRVRSVAHPIFVEICDVGIQLGVPFVAYELDSRPTLAQLVEREKLSPEFALRVARRLLGGLVVAHTAGIFHGDLTPTNVLCSPGDDDVRVVGLGIAPLLRLASPDATGPTGRGSGKGAVRYLAPEVLAGDRGSIATDIFAVGALIHLMVTRSPPGQDGVVDVDVPGLAEVVERAMHRDPARRYQSASEMLASLELKPVKGREPSAAIPLWDEARTPRAKEEKPKRSVWVWAAPILILIAAAAAAVYLGQNGTSDDVAVAQGQQEGAPTESGSGTDEASTDEAPADDDPAGDDPADDDRADEGDELLGQDDVAGDPPIEDLEVERGAGESGASDAEGPLGGVLPEFLATTMAQIADGYTFEEDDFRAIYGWIANNRDDVRGHLVLCRAFMSRGWHSAAFERYEHVLRSNGPEAKSDPRTLTDLVTVAAHGEDMVVSVTAVFRRFYGDELDLVAAEVDSQLAATDERAARRQLDSLQRRVERLRR